MKFWQYAVIAAFLFICMYDPTSGGMDNYIRTSPIGGLPSKSVDSREITRSCEPHHFQAIQFADNSTACPNQGQVAQGGAIIKR